MLSFYILYSLAVLDHYFKSCCSYCPCVLRVVQVPSGGSARGLSGEEHQQPGDQLLFAERSDHLDPVPDPGGCLHWSRFGRLQWPCHRIHSAGRWAGARTHTHTLTFIKTGCDIYANWYRMILKHFVYCAVILAPSAFVLVHPVF